MTMPEKMIGIKEFARQTHYSERVIRQYCLDGKIEGAQKLGGKGRKWLIPESSVLKLQGQTEPQTIVQQPASGHRYVHQVEILPKLCKYLHDIEAYSQLMTSSVMVGEKQDEYPKLLHTARIAANNELEDGRLFLPVNFTQQVDAFFQKVFEMQEQFHFSTDPKTPDGPERAKAWNEAGTIARHEIPALLKIIDDQARRIISGEQSDYGTINQLNIEQKDSSAKLPLEFVKEDQEKHWQDIESHLMALEQDAVDVDTSGRPSYRSFGWDGKMDDELRSHLRDTLFWQNINDYNEKANEANGIRKELYEEITLAALRVAPLEDIWLEPIQEQCITPHFITSVIDLSLGKVIPYIRRYKWDELNQFQTCQAMYISKGIKSEKEHRELVETYSKDERIMSLKDTTPELNNLRGEILTRLHSAVNDKEYKYLFCNKCPLIRSGHIKQK